ncbi:MAG: hypothetical protein K2N11_01640 [Mucispirillum sp.]|nr:hypothetical protein [Mucispirillum sp.]
MTKEQLKEFNGKNGKPAYIGYKGKVYDISKSDFWSGGEHMGRFKAGEDLTDSIDMSPHGEKNIFRFEAVDTLEDGTAQETNTETVVPNSENLLSDMDKKMIAKRQWYKRNHPHPKIIHFSIGMFGLAFFLQILSIILYLIDYRIYKVPTTLFISSFSVLTTIFAVLFTLPAIASGALSFYINYNGFANSILKKKIAGSIILLIVSVIAAFVGYREVVSVIRYNPIFSFYTVLSLVNFIIVTFIASNGGKLTWPQDKK